MLLTNAVSLNQKYLDEVQKVGERVFANMLQAFDVTNTPLNEKKSDFNPDNSFSRVLIIPTSENTFHFLREREEGNKVSLQYIISGTDHVGANSPATTAHEQSKPLIDAFIITKEEEQIAVSFLVSERINKNQGMLSSPEWVEVQYMKSANDLDLAVLKIKLSTMHDRELALSQCVQNWTYESSSI